MSRLDDANNAFELFQNSKIRVHVIRDSTIETLWPLCDAVRIALRDNEAEVDVVQRYKRPMFRLRRIATGLPLPFNDPALEMSVIAEELMALSKEDQGAIVKAQLQKSAQIATELGKTATNQLEIKLRELIREDSTIVIQDAYWRPVLSKWLIREFPQHANLVVTIGELNDYHSFKHLVFLGSPFYFSYRHFRDNDLRFLRDPKSLENDFITYPFGEQALKISGLVSDQSPLRTITSSEPLISTFNFDELDEESEWTSIENDVKDPGSRDEDAEVLARFYGLAGGHFIYFEDDPRTSVFVLQRDREDKLDVSRIGIRDLRTNQFVLVRTEGASSGLIVEIADELGAANLRVSQLRYKELLQRKIKESGGIRSVQKDLNDNFGLVSNNLADWAFNPRRIGPGSEANFRKLCDYLEIPNEAKKIWGHLERIRAFHIRAGSEAVKRLQEALRKIPAKDPALMGSGFITRSIKGCGEIGVYRVEHIGEPQLVNVYQLQIPYIQA